jgi:hypothetical protein
LDSSTFKKLNGKRESIVIKSENNWKINNMLLKELYFKLNIIRRKIIEIKGVPRHRSQDTNTVRKIFTGSWVQGISNEKSMLFLSCANSNTWSSTAGRELSDLALCRLN